MKFYYILFLLFCVELVANQVLVLGDSNSNVEFIAFLGDEKTKVRGHSREGAARAITGKALLKDFALTADADFDLRLLETEESLQTRFLQEKVLQTAKFPSAGLAITSLLLSHSFSETEFHEQGVSFRGRLKWRNHTAPVQGIAHVLKKNDRLEVSLEFPVNQEAFKVPRVSWQGLVPSLETKVFATFKGTIKSR